MREEYGFPVHGEHLEVRIANAACYIAQKLLVLDKRDPKDRAKDLVYVHDAILLFAPALGSLAELWRQAEAPTTKRARSVAGIARTLGASVGDDARRAVQLLHGLDRGHRPDERGFVATLNEGLTQLFPSR